jgi:transcription antitermination factor NusG
MTHSILPHQRTNTNLTSNWYVFYTYPRAEKVIYSDLVKKGYDTFLPLQRTLKEYKCRHKKWIEEVLFPGYIFVKSSVDELYRIKNFPKVVTFIHCAGKPSIVSEKHIEILKTMLGMNTEIFIENEFVLNEQVRIMSGPLAGYEGTVKEYKGKTRFGVQLQAINRTVFVDVSTTVLERVRQPQVA